ncbi:Retrovirus Polyprotein [Phytophthora cinnamomi]|uniref:Retrovirus Polyprotein n=1 Tax=Phytophthora cinnamomi TaxID=4785 RepID=UPI003559D7F4|nr:Retrovirus Polyprotein [Phytophthora cinnamomi]
MRGERLVEYAQSLREIGERGDVGEDWLVNAFLKGMSSPEGTTHVRGHRPQTLDEAMNLASPHISEYGEGYGVGLETAMSRWDERETSSGRGPGVGAATRTGGQEQSGLTGNFGSVVTGYGPMWGTAVTPPRYDTEGRQVSAGKASAEWWKAIAPCFQLVPVGTRSSQGDGSKFRTASSDQFAARGKRPAPVGDQNPRRPAKALKVEGSYGSGAPAASGGVSDPALATREGRLLNQQRFVQRREQPRREFTPRPGTECYYCGRLGHFVRFCDLKEADLQPSGTGAVAGATENTTEESGNGPRA